MFVADAGQASGLDETELARSNAPPPLSGALPAAQPVMPAPLVKNASPETVTRAEAIRFAEGRPIVLFVGRLVAYKGIDVLIDSMQAIPATAVIVGSLITAVRVKTARVVTANVLIALGVAANGASGLLNSLVGETRGFVVMLALGITLLFAGFLTATTRVSRSAV